MEGLEPLEIGHGSLADGSGLAVSEYSGTEGYIYVPDAGTKTLKVYDPTGDKVNPVQVITGPGKGFTSLRDSAVAVDRVTGHVYVVDDLASPFTEKPEAVIDVFAPHGRLYRCAEVQNLRCSTAWACCQQFRARRTLNGAPPPGAGLCHLRKHEPGRGIRVSSRSPDSH